MTFRHRTEIVALALCLVSGGGMATAGSAIDAQRVQAELTLTAEFEPSILATIDGVAVTAADADALRAILQPPPSRERAGRLAVDAALAFWDMHGWLAGSSAQGRLDAWKFWVGVDGSGSGSSLDQLLEIRKRAAAGAPGSERSSEALRRYKESMPASAFRHVEWIRIDAESAVFRRTTLPWTALHPDLAHAARRAGSEAPSGPISVAGSLFWIRSEVHPR